MAEMIAETIIVISIFPKGNLRKAVKRKSETRQIIFVVLIP